MHLPGATQGAEVGIKQSALDPWQLLDELPRVVVVVDVPSGRIEYANRHACALSPVPLVGALLTDIAPFMPMHLYRKALVEGSAEAESVQYAPEGMPPRFYEVSMRAISNRSVISSGVDITERVRLSKELEARERELEKTIQLRDDFIGMASHELRTPLTAILLHCARLKGGFKPEMVALSVSRMERCAHSINSLISNLLDVSKIQHGDIKLDPEPINLYELVSDLENRLRELSEQADCQVQVDCEGNPIIGNWDRACLETVIMNLLTNAFKYGRGKPVVIQLAKVHDKAFVTIKDQGVGIAPEDQHRIFEQFQRAGTKRFAPGLGLGLWIVQRILSTMGGHIEVDSQPQQGAAFTVALPLVGG
jgi:signal transduction histidine kinase